MEMWESPIYRLRVPKNDDDYNSNDLKEIVIDVTGSAPVFEKPSNGLIEILNDIFYSGSFKKVSTVLEFGAAKLKNIPYILEQGKSVCACDFEKLTKNKYTKKNIAKCELFGNKFQKMVFPNPFISDTRKFDLALLLNVLPVMPVPAERLFVLKLLYDKINHAKYLLWVAQKEGPYKKIRESGKYSCGDGIWRGERRRFKTFYKYFQVDELDELMELFGFKRIKIYSIGDDARLYEKTKYTLLSEILTEEKINKYFSVDNTIQDPITTSLNIVKRTSEVMPVIPNPRELSVEVLYIEKIKGIPVGVRNAEIYHRTVSNAMRRIFRGHLRNMDLKVRARGGGKVLDTVFTNVSRDGFFHHIKNKLDCSYPVIEVKNISGDPTNDEFDQLNGYLQGSRGDFGILMCRKVDDENKVYQIAKDYVSKNHMIFLTDDNIIKMLEYSREKNETAINDLMDSKFKNLIF